VIKQEEPPLKSGAGCVKREFQARFRENVRVKFPRVSRLPAMLGRPFTTTADVGLMFVAFNVRRLMNIIDKKAFKKFLQELAFFDNEILTTSKSIKAQIRYLFLTNTNSISINQAA